MASVKRPRRSNHDKSNRIERDVGNFSDWDAIAFSEAFYDYPQTTLDKLKGSPDEATMKLSNDWERWPVKSSPYSGEESSLHVCVRQGWLGLFKVLLELGANPLVKYKSSNGSTSYNLLHCICGEFFCKHEYDTTEIVDVSTSRKDFVLCLFGELKKTNREGLFRGLLREETDKAWKATPLLHAARYSYDFPLLELLLKYGADTHVLCAQGFSAHTWAIDCLRESGEKKQANVSIHSLIQSTHVLYRAMRIDAKPDFSFDETLFWTLAPLLYEKRPIKFSLVEELVEEMQRDGVKLETQICISPFGGVSSSLEILQECLTKPHLSDLKETAVQVLELWSSSNTSSIPLTPPCSTSASARESPCPSKTCKGRLGKRTKTNAASRSGKKLPDLESDCTGALHARATSSEEEKEALLAELAAQRTENEALREKLAAAERLSARQRDRILELEGRSGGGGNDSFSPSVTGQLASLERENEALCCARGGGAAAPFSGVGGAAPTTGGNSGGGTATGELKPRRSSSVSVKCRSETVDCTSGNEDCACKNGAKSLEEYDSSEGHAVQTFCSAFACALKLSARFGRSISKVDVYSNLGNGPSKKLSKLGVELRWTKQSDTDELVCDGCEQVVDLRRADIDAKEPVDANGIPYCDFFCSECKTRSEMPERPQSKVGKKCYDKSDKTWWMIRALYLREGNWVYAIRQINSGPSKDQIGKADKCQLASELDHPNYVCEPAEASITARCHVYPTFGEMRARAEADAVPAVSLEDIGALRGGDGCGAGERNVNGDHGASTSTNSLLFESLSRSSMLIEDVRKVAKASIKNTSVETNFTNLTTEQNSCIVSRASQVILDSKLSEDKREAMRKSPADSIYMTMPWGPECEITEIEKERINTILSSLRADQTLFGVPSCFVESIKLCKINQDDPRVGLRGQLGVFATQMIRKDRIIGPYSGSIIDEESLDYGSVKEKRDRTAYQYTFQTTGFEHLVIDCYRHKGGPHHGNETMFINDPRGLPRKSKQRRQLSGANCMFVEIVHRGWPFAFVVATQDIREGEELLVEYGSEYWTAMEEFDRCLDKTHGA